MPNNNKILICRGCHQTACVCRQVENQNEKSTSPFAVPVGTGADSITLERVQECVA